MSQKVLKSRNNEPTSPDRAYLYALRLLTGRDYTTLQLERKLRTRDYSEADTEAAVARLKTEGCLNDRRYAERFAELALANARYIGPRLRLEMRRRGVPPELIADVVDRMKGEHDEEMGARTLLERRFPGFSYATAADRERRRVIAFLQRRGFSIDSIRDAMR